ncbi:MAG TPA: hypothetical protein VF060_20840 [Trebonia sp.]
MHPELMRDLMIQRTTETMARAHEARLARAARKLERARRDLAEASRTFAVPEIPDYVDGMFGGTGQGPTRDSAPDQRAA